MRNEFHPWDLAVLQVPTSTRLRVVEILSRETPSKTVMVRMVPGDSATLREIQVSELLPHKARRYVHTAEIWFPNADGVSTFAFPEDMLRYDNAALYDWTADEKGRSAGIVFIYSVSNQKDPQWTSDRWKTYDVSIHHVITFDRMTGEHINRCREIP